MSRISAGTAAVLLLYTAGCVAGSKRQNTSAAPVIKRYNQDAQVACHNCYFPKLFHNLQVPLGLTRGLEIDVHHTGAKPGQWFVNHERDGNYSNCEAQTAGAHGDLQACLRIIHEEAVRRPARDVITVFVDLKDGWGKEWSPTHLDSLARRALPSEILYTPALVQGDEPSLQAMATGNQWPSMDALVGRVLLVLTGDNTRLNQYLEQTDRERVFFVAPSIRSTMEVTHPKRISPSHRQHIVFYNVDLQIPVATAEYRADVLRKIRRSRSVSRVWYSEEVLLGPAWAADLLYLPQRCAYVRSGVNFFAAYLHLIPLPSSKQCGAEAIDGTVDEKADIGF